MFTTLPNNKTFSNLYDSSTLELLSFLTHPIAAAICILMISVIDVQIFVLDIKTASGARQHNTVRTFGNIGVFSAIFDKQICNATRRDGIHEDFYFY